MAAVTSLNALGTTTNAATYTTSSSTPSSGALLCAFAGVTTETSSDWAMSDSLGGTWQKAATRRVKNSSADIVEFWVCTSLASGSALTFTYSHASGAASGAFIHPIQVTGMTLTGSAAVRQDAGVDNQSSGSPLSTTFSLSALTGNPTVTCEYIGTAAPGTTPPTGWTTLGTTGWNTPTSGSKVCSRDSGFTGTTITWGSNALAAYCGLSVELDASVPASSQQTLGLLGVGS